MNTKRNKAVNWVAFDFASRAGDEDFEAVQTYPLGAYTRLEQRSFSQEPACSLRDNDEHLAILARVPLQEWTETIRPAINHLIPSSEGRIFFVKLLPLFVDAQKRYKRHVKNARRTNDLKRERKERSSYAQRADPERLPNANTDSDLNKHSSRTQIIRTTHKPRGLPIPLNPSALSFGGSHPDIDLIYVLLKAAKKSNPAQAWRDPTPEDLEELRDAAGPGTSVEEISKMLSAMGEEDGSDPPASYRDFAKGVRNQRARAEN